MYKRQEVYLAHGLPEIMSVTLLPTIIFVAMIFVDWRLALGMIAGAPLMYLVKVLSQKTMDKNFAIYFNHEMCIRDRTLRTAIILSQPMMLKIICIPKRKPHRKRVINHLS